MTKVGLIKFIMLFIFVSPVWAQKVKYKDIFELLKSKQFEQAEPFLKLYLAANDDNPNAYLYMGMIYQEKSSKNDILRQTSQSLVNMDSAIFYYEKANATITEKEVKRNKEYYQAYNRRDMRTGEYGVTLSDIQFDVQKRIEAMKERSDKLKMVKFYFDLSDSLYRKTIDLYSTFQKTYPGEKELYLRADDEELKRLTALGVRYDSCVKAFETYKSSLQNLGKTGYNQSLQQKEITEFQQTLPASDFYAEEVTIFNFRKFSDKSREIIQKEIYPIKENILSYDVELNKLREKLNSDSASVRSDLTKLIDKMLQSQLKKYDPNPLPMAIFALKGADLEYRSMIIEHKHLRDSADIALQVSLISNEMAKLNSLDSIAGAITGRNLDADIENYKNFIDGSYGNSVILASYVKALKEFAEREIRNKQKELTDYQDALNWLTVGESRVPLTLSSEDTTYKPLAVVDEKYTTGLKYADSLSATGYMLTITPSRIPDVNVSFPVDKGIFKASEVPNTKAITYADPNGQIYFILFYLDKIVNEKCSVTVAKIYRIDGLSWTGNFQLPFIPKEIVFKSDTNELVIASGEKQARLDKNGKLLK